MFVQRFVLFALLLLAARQASATPLEVEVLPRTLDQYSVALGNDGSVVGTVGGRASVYRAGNLHVIPTAGSYPIRANKSGVSITSTTQNPSEQCVSYRINADYSTTELVLDDAACGAKNVYYDAIAVADDGWAIFRSTSSDPDSQSLIVISPTNERRDIVLSTANYYNGVITGVGANEGTVFIMTASYSNLVSPKILAVKYDGTMRDINFDYRPSNEIFSNANGDLVFVETTTQSTVHPQDGSVSTTQIPRELRNADFLYESSAQIAWNDQRRTNDGDLARLSRGTKHLSLACAIPNRSEMKSVRIESMNRNNVILLSWTDSRGNGRYGLVKSLPEHLDDYCVSMSATPVGACKNSFRYANGELTQFKSFPDGAGQCTFQVKLTDSKNKPVSKKKVEILVGSGASREQRGSATTGGDGVAVVKGKLNIHESYGWELRFWKDKVLRTRSIPIHLKSL